MLNKHLTFFQLNQPTRCSKFSSLLSFKYNWAW